MKKDNMLSLALKAVRDSGLTNMWEKNSVQYWAFQMGFFEFVTWLEENKGDYVLFMLCTDFDVLPTIDTKLLLEQDEATEARLLVERMFEKEIAEHKEKSGFDTIVPFPASYADFEQSKEFLYNFLNTTDKHAMNYLFNACGETVLFTDGLYETSGEKLKIDEEKWAEITRQKEQFSADKTKKYEILNKRFRLKTLYKQ